MAEWFKAAVLKTVVRKYRGFESYSLRQKNSGEMTELADGARLLSECGDKTPPRVRIPLSPPNNKSSGPGKDLSFCCLQQKIRFLLSLPARNPRAVNVSPSRLCRFRVSLVPTPSPVLWF